MGTQDSKCGRGLQYVLSAVAPQRKQNLKMAERNGLSSQESEELVDEESAEDVLKEKIDLCLQAFESLDLCDVNLDMFKRCVRKQIVASYRVFQSPTDPLKILLNSSVNCGTVLDCGWRRSKVVWDKRSASGILIKAK